MSGAGVEIKKAECQYLTKSVEYLGHEMSSDGVQPSPEEVQGIIKALCTSNSIDVERFGGLCTYYSRFIANFSSAFVPLYGLYKKNVEFVYTKDHQT